jgi:hypothetical protein
MSGPLMAVASTEVQNEFIKLKEFMMQSTGAMMPEGVPSPMEAAMMQNPQEEMAMGQGGPMQFPQQGAM